MTGFEKDTCGAVEFSENSEPRCPCLLLLDMSGPTSGLWAKELNEGLTEFKLKLAADTLAAKRVEMAIVTFGPVRVVSNFQTLTKFDPPKLVPTSERPTGAAVERGLDLLRMRMTEYHMNGVLNFRSRVFLVTNGSPDDSVSGAAKAVRFGENRKDFMFYAVGADGADMVSLQKIATREPLRLKRFAFREFFNWLSASLISVVRSDPGEAVALLNPATINGWLETSSDLLHCGRAGGQSRQIP